MFDKLSIPVKGEPPKAAWGAGVANRLNELCAMAPARTLVRDGATGTGFAPLPQNRRDRRAAAELHPWKVFAVGKSEDVGHLFEIYIPDGSITVGRLAAEIEGVTEAELEKRFVFDCEDDVGEESTLYLVVRKGDVDEDEAEYVAELAVELDEYEEDESVTDVIPIAVLSVNTEGDNDKGVVVRQLTRAAIHLNPAGVTSLIGTDGDNESVRIDGDVVVDGSKCGITVKTVLKEPEIEDGEESDETPKPIPTMEIDVSGREDAQGCDNTENWGCQPMKLPGGGLAHFLGCRPVDLSNAVTSDGDGGGGAENVIGSEYIDVDDEEEDTGEVDEDGNPILVTKRKVSAKVDTADPVPSDEDEIHALLTNDTDQIVRSKKTFAGSGLVANNKRVIIDGPNGVVEVVGSDGNKSIKLDAGEIPGSTDCPSQKIGVHKLTYYDKDLNPPGSSSVHHILACSDIDLRKMGKCIATVDINCSAAPGGVNTMVFNYTDGTSDTFRVQNGLDGAPGAPGSSGGDDDDPEPVDPGDDDYLTEDDLTTLTVVTGVRYAIENGKLVAKLSRKRIKAIVDENLGDETVNVCDAKEVTVVTGEAYDTTSHQFTNTRRTVTVMGDAAAQGQTPFTATPHSSET